MYRLLILLLFIPFISYSQNTLGTQAQGIDFNSYSFGAIEEFDDTNKSVKGSPYLLEEFEELVVITDANDTILFESANFNLNTMNLEFKKADGMRYFSSKYFNTFFDNRYFKGKYIIKKFSSLDEEQVSGLFQIVNENSEYSLIKHYQFSIKESNYNPVLEHGDKNDVIKIDENIYLLHDFRLIPIERSKRKFSKYFSGKDEILTYIRDNDLSFKDLSDLSELTNYLNENEFKVNL
jgi:hypothetical protein